MTECTTTNKKQLASHSVLVVPGSWPKLFIENRYFPILYKNIPFCVLCASSEAGGKIILSLTRIAKLGPSAYRLKVLLT